MKSKLPTIPTPLNEHWRRCRYQLVPVVVLCAAVFGVCKLWQNRQNPNAIGEAQAVRIPIRTQVAGVVDSLPGGSLRLFDRVKEGQVLARLTEMPKHSGSVLDLVMPSMLIRSPAAGIVTAIRCQPGQVVKAGEELCIVTCDQCEHIVAYINQNQRLKAEPGQPATVMPRAAICKPLEASILRVGPEVELIPAHQRHDPRRKEWGRPVVIALPNDYVVHPGELLDVVFPLN